MKQIRRPRLQSGISRIRKNIQKEESDGQQPGKKDPVKYIRDKKGRLADLAAQVIKENKQFKLLKLVNLIFCYRTPCRIDKDQQIVAGQARKMPAQARDLFMVDFLIEMAYDVWKFLGPKAKYRLMWHELNHCVVVLDESMQPKRDRHGRIKLKIEHHDLVVKTFRDEVIKFGTAGHHNAVAKFLKSKAKKKAKELNTNA